MGVASGNGICLGNMPACTASSEQETREKIHTEGTMSLTHSDIMTLQGVYMSNVCFLPQVELSEHHVSLV